MGISKKDSHIVYDNLDDSFYFILPDDSDRRIPYRNLLDDIDWDYVYKELYVYKNKYNIDIFKGNLKEVLGLIECYI